MANILDEPLAPPETAPVPNFFLTLFLFLFSGGWLYYFNPAKKQKIIYLLCFWYSWLGFINVFLVMDYHSGIKLLERFHNHSSVGVGSLFLGWFIYYVIGFMDWLFAFQKLENAKKTTK